MIQAAQAPVPVAKPAMVLSHGTLEIDDVQASMRFYREFLGMETIQHVPFGCRVALGAEWYVVCLEVKHPHDMPIFNHFGFDCATKADVDAWHARTLAEQEAFGILEVTRPRSLHGAYSFFLKDRDRNWWEIQYYEGDAKEKHLVWGQRMLAKAEERLRRQAATTG